MDGREKTDWQRCPVAKQPFAGLETKTKNKGRGRNARGTRKMERAKLEMVGLSYHRPKRGVAIT
jgi:hypothetical protein